MKSKKTKRALISSVLALVLCFVMLLGTTFAWFTDTASTKVNTIQAGKLDVALEDEDGNSLENGILSWQKNEQGKGQEVLWEPGATYNLQNVVIKNNGNLALKYKVVISGIEGDAKLNDAIEWTISTVKNVEGEEETPEIDTQAVGEESAAETEPYLLPGESATLTISGHMKEKAGNEYQGLSIDSVAIAVEATQYTYEYDSTTNQYDKNANFDFAWDGETTTAPKADEDGVYHITSAAQLAWMMDDTNMKNGEDIQNSAYNNCTFVLDCDVDFNGATIAGIGSRNMQIGFVFDGNGHTISNFVINAKDAAHAEDNGEYRYAGLFQQFSGGTIENLTVRNATVIGDQMAGIIASSADANATIENCNVYDSTVIGAKKVGAVVGYTAGATVKGCHAENCTVIASDSREEQSGEIVGYVNIGSTVEDNTATNVTVNYNTGTVTTISTKAELFDFAESVNVNKNSYKGQTVVLTADIDLGNTPWTPIGDVTNQDKFFQGTFDGNGHTIYNLYVDMSSDSSTDYTTAGLFGWVDAANGGCTIKNLTIDGATVKGNHYTGAVVGFMTGTIDNCHVKNATIVSTYLDTENSGDKAGGVAGYLNANTKCTNCIVSDSTITAARDAGQVIGCLGESATQSNNTAEEVTVSGNGVNIKNDVVGRDDNNT